MSFHTQYTHPIAIEIRGKIGKETIHSVSPYRGIYQMRHCKIGYVPIKMKFYEPYNPQTEPQQTNRQKLADAVAAWQSLTTEQKRVYNKNAVGQRFTGYNLFIREYMLS